MLGYSSLNGIIDQLRQQADEEERKRKEAEAAALFRQQVPIGPPTQAQAQSMGQQPLHTNQAAWNPPYKQPDISIPKPQPFPQVGHTGPTVSTQTPQVQSSQALPTVPSLVQAPQPKVEAPKPSVAPSQPFVHPIGPTMPSPIATWRGAPPVASAPPVGANVQGLVGAIAPSINDIFWHPQDYGDAFGKLMAQAGKTPVGIATQMALDKIARRHEENQYNAITVPNLGKMLGDTYTGKAAMVLGMDVIDLMGLGKDILTSLPAPGSNGATIGTQYAKVRDVGEQYNANARPDFLKPITDMFGLNRLNDIAKSFTGQDVFNPSFLAVLDPKVWGSISNTAQYWDLSNKRVNQAFAVTPEQKAANSQEQIDYAKNLAVFMAPNSIGEMKSVFQEQLNTPIQISDYTKQAQDFLDQAAQETNAAAKQLLMAKAGNLGAQALKLRETTPLDMYNKHTNLWYSMPADFLFDPFQLWGSISELAHLTPAARRAAGAEKLMATTALNSNETVGDVVKDGIQWLMQTQRSKAKSDAYTVHDVLTNMLSSLNTKGDLITGIRKVLDGSIIQGIPLAELNDPTQALSAANGIVPFDKAGVLDYRFQNAVKSFQNVLGWIPNLPSLAGDPAEIANKLEVQGDILGMLTRAAAQSHNVSTMGEVPYGAKAFEVVPTLSGKAFVQWVGDEKKVLGQSAEMTALKAQRMADNLTNALKTGSEFKTNYIRAVGDFRRAVISNFGLNTNLGGIIGNTMSGLFTSVIDGTGVSLISTEEKLADIASKTGGFLPNTRVAAGAGIEPANVYKAMSTGMYQTPVGKIMNALTLGTAKIGREIRQGETALAGIPVGEEALALNIYHSAFKSFFNDHWNQVRPLVDKVLEGKVLDEATRINIIDRIHQAGISGGRQDVAKVFADIANGKPAISLRSIAPWATHVLTPKQVLELDDLLSGLTPDALPQATQRISDIFGEQASKLAADSTAFINEGPGRHYFTTAWDAQDLADIERQLSVAAKNLGKSPDEVKSIAQSIGPLKQNVSRQMFELLQMLRDQPNKAVYVHDLWNQINAYADIQREEIGKMVLPMVNAADRSAGPVASPAVLGKMWQDYWDSIPQKWNDYGKLASQAIEQARTDFLPGGKVDQILARGFQPTFDMTNGMSAGLDPVGTASEILSDMSVNTDEALGWLGTQVGWAEKDPKWKLKTEALSKAYEAGKAKMFTMLSRYPTEAAFDEFNSAFHDVKIIRQRVTGKLQQYRKAVNDAQATGDQSAIAKAFAILNDQTNRQWDYFWQQAIARTNAGAFRIAEVNLPQEISDTLRFRPPGATTDWQLLGPNLFQKNMWDVLGPDPRDATKLVKTTMAIATKNAVGIPQTVIDTFNKIRAGSEAELWDQIGRFGAQATTREGGIPQVDWTTMTDTAKDMVSTIRQRVSEYMANYNKDLYIPADVQGWSQQKLDSARQALLSVVDKIAEANVKGYGKFDLGTVSDFNSKVLPLFDNVVTGSQEYAKQMMSFGMVDFTKEYHPDVLLALAAPYHYWWSRMGKNAVERLLFNPKVYAGMGEFFRSIESINRQQGQPNRNIESMPFGAQVGDTQYRPGATVLFRWIPFAPNMVMSGYADPDIANQAFEYGNEMATGQAFPNTTRKLAANAIYGYELAKQLGLNTFGDVDALVSWASGNPQAWQGKVGEMSSLFRVMGYGAVRLANWAKENNYPLVGNAAQGFATATIPGYFPYLTGRTASFEAQRGNLTDPQAQMAQDVAAQDFSQYSGAGALSPMPEQAFIDPQAAQQYRDLQNQTATEYFIRGLITYLTGVPIAASYGPELELRKAQAMQRLSGYDAGKNPEGSQAAYYGYTTLGNPNYARGLAPFNSQYAVTAETAPGVRDETVKRPGLGAVQTSYYDELSAVNDKYKQEQADTYKQHPEWSTTDRAAMAAKKAYDDDWKARKQAELDKITGNPDTGIPSKYPTLQNQEKREGINTFNQRPEETVAKVQDALVAKAYEMAGDRTTYANGSEWYNKVQENLQALMNDPKAIAEATYGSSANTPPYTPDKTREGYVPQNASPGTSSIQQPLPVAAGSSAFTPTVPSQSPTAAQPSTSFVPDPKNQWADLMAQEEAKYGLPSGILQAIAKHESNFTPDAGNTSSGAQGMMQFMPSTWAGLPADLKAGDPKNPEDAIKAAAYYMSVINKQLPADKQNDPAWMAAAYNIGAGAAGPMKSLDDIASTKYADAKARAQYAKDIGQEVAGGAVPNAGAATAGTQPSSQSFTNPNWGRVEGPYTVVGTPITDSGITWVSPVPDGTKVYQYYGEQNVDNLKDYYAKVNKGFGHEGIDWMLPEGTHINAVADGTVVWASDGTKAGRPAYGNLIIVDNGNGYRSLYGHLSAFNVKVGDKVAAGQYIGDVGHTPESANIGNHLHLAIEKKGDTTGPWNTVDPFRLIGQSSPLTTPASPGTMTTAGQTPGSPVSQVTTAPVTTSPVSPESAPASPSAPVQQPTTPAGSGTPLMPWTGTADELLNNFNNRNNSPERVQAQASVDQAFADIKQRAVTTYPQYADLYDQYQALPDDQQAKQDFTAQHPQIRALNMAGYNPDQWKYLEDTFGKGIVEKWAAIPPYTGEGGDERSQYYHQYPDVFLANAWVRGRPELYDDSAYDPTKSFAYNFGKDYEEAKSKFGSGIWDTVRQYYATPPYQKGGDNTAWIQFKTDHPEFDDWRVWWYEKLGNAQTSGYQPYQGGYRPHAGYSNGAPGRRTPPNYVNQVGFRNEAPPVFHAPSSGNADDWKQWLALTASQLKGWRG